MGETPAMISACSGEMAAYNPELLDRPYLVALNKIDTEEAADHLKKFHKDYHFPAHTLFEISAAYGEGLEKLLKEITKRLEKKRGAEYDAERKKKARKDFDEMISENQEM